MKTPEMGLRDEIKSLLKGQSALALSWIESPLTSAGVPDLSYCIEGIEGWIELKAGPDFEVRPTQKQWFRERVAAGGHPLFLVSWGGKSAPGPRFYVVPGSRWSLLASANNEYDVENVASTVWRQGLPLEPLLNIMRNPQNEY